MVQDVITLLILMLITLGTNYTSGRNSNTPASPRYSQSQNLGEIHRLETVYPSIVLDHLSFSVDIVAIRGLSETETVDQSWVFNILSRTKITPSRQADASYIPTVDSIKEGASKFGNFAEKLVVTVATVANPFVGQSEDQDSHAETPQKEESVVNSPGIRSSKASINSETNDVATTRQVNWLKDGNMLPAAFPKSRIMAYTYPTHFFGTAEDGLENVALNLLEKLSVERKTCGPGLSRPIIFIGHSFGGIVISKALAIAHEGEHFNIAVATAGLIFCKLFLRHMVIKPSYNIFLC